MDYPPTGEYQLVQAKLARMYIHYQNVRGLLGGNGYMREYRVEQLARDAKLLQIGGGTDEIQLISCARALLRGETKVG